MVMEPDDFVPFVLGEAVLVQEIEGVVPVATNAKVENTETDFLGDVGEVVFWIRAHPDLNTENTESAEDHGAKNKIRTKQHQITPNSTE